MEHIAAAEEQIVTERNRRKLEEVNASAQSQLSPVQDHINFTLQQAYFKCAYESFDRSRKQEEIANCVEHCFGSVMELWCFWVRHATEDMVANMIDKLCVFMISMSKSEAPLCPDFILRRTAKSICFILTYSN